jgi:hypothetical protein
VPGLIRSPALSCPMTTQTAGFRAGSPGARQDSNDFARQRSLNIWMTRQGENRGLMGG